MTQSAVSQQIAALEASYDSILFKRKGRHIEATAEGKALYDWIRPVIGMVEEFPDRFRALKNLEHGKLRIGSTEEAALALTPFLTRFCATYPRIEVSLAIDEEKELKPLALNDVFDFIVVDEVPDLRHDPAFHYQVWGENALKLITPRLARLLMDGKNILLEQETFLMHATDISLRSFINKFFSLIRSFPKRVIEVGNVGAIKKMVQEGVGISILSELSVEAEVQARLVNQVNNKELKGLRRKTMLLLPTNREIVYSAWAFRSMFEKEIRVKPQGSPIRRPG